MCKKKIPYLPSVGRLLGFSNKFTSGLSDKKLKKYDLTLPQWVLLTALWSSDGLTVGQLAIHYQSSEPSTSNLIARMEKKGLVERRRDTNDRRQVYVYLTGLGKSKSGQIYFYNEINDLILDGFNENEKQQFIEMLERVIENAKRAVSD